MTKLRYVGTYAQEFPGSENKLVMLGPGEFLEDADTEDEYIKAAMERGELIPTEGSFEDSSLVVIDNVPDDLETETQIQQTEQTQTQDTGTGTGEEVTNA